jgi:hypothetical protein
VAFVTVDSAPTTPAVADLAAPQLNPSQRRTFDELLAVGAERPRMRPGLVDDLRARIETGTRDALASWTESSLWFGKSDLTTVARCEGLVVARSGETRTRALHPTTMAGIVAHKAIEVAHTHPDQTVAWYCEQALAAAQREDAFGATYAAMSVVDQSDVLMTALSKVTGFLDSWPPLDERWVWRFEESMQARAGRLVLGARIDLVLGRAKADGRQTMFLADFKTGPVGEQHELEASFYALVSTLRHGIAPFRSTVFSLASGEWTSPDVTAERLEACAARVVDAVNATVSLRLEQRGPHLTGGPHCRWCPARADCPSSSMADPAHPGDTPG